MPEIIVIMVIALIIFGPSKFPEVARSVGKGIKELKDMTSGVEKTMKKEFDAIMDDGDASPKPGGKPKAEETTKPAADAGDEVVFPGETNAETKTEIKTETTPKDEAATKPVTKTETKKKAATKTKIETEAENKE